jgi:hypothetical protein
MLGIKFYKIKLKMINIKMQSHFIINYKIYKMIELKYLLKN